MCYSRLNLCLDVTHIICSFSISPANFFHHLVS